MHILEPLPKIERGSLFEMAIPDRYTKVTVEVSTSKITPGEAAFIFIERWAANFGILSKTVTNYGPQLPSVFSVAM